MGWLTAVIKVVPKLFKAGANGTSYLWNGGKAVVGAGGKVVNAAVKHPKTSVAAGIATYAGWKSIGSDDSYATAVGEASKDVAKGVGNFAHDVVNGFTGKETVEDVTEGTAGVLSDIKETANETKGVLGALGDSLKGITSFLGNIMGGNGTGMFSRFFDNIGKGNISMLGIGGLVAAGYMLFGRTGLLGKIGGALLAMMMIGSNSQAQAQTQHQAQSPAVGQGEAQEQPKEQPIEQEQAPKQEQGQADDQQQAPARTVHR